MNQATLSGRIGRDPELRTMPNGDPVLSWPLAVDTGTKDKPDTLWVDCSLFGRRATSLQQYLAKGDKLVAMGRISMRTYQAKDGTPKQALQMAIDQVDFMSGKQQAAPAAAPAPVAKPGRPRPSDEDISDDEIPF